MTIEGLKHEKRVRREQLQVINKVIENIQAGKYHNASILIRFDLNNKSYYWYKPIERIIENQITNLFYDIEHNTFLTLEFFQHQANKQTRRIKTIDGIINRYNSRD